MINEQLKLLLDENTWCEYQECLTFFADREIRGHLSSQQGGETLLDGMGAADFAAQGLLDVLTDDKHWDSTECPKLLTFLFRVVRDQVRNAARRHGTTHIKYVEDDDAFGIDENAPSPQNDTEAKLFVEGFVGYLESQGDDDLLLIVYCFVEGQERADVASSLGLSAADVTNMRKQLHRRLEAYRAQNQTIRSA